MTHTIKKPETLPGIDNLLNNHLDMLNGKRIGLVAHPASVNAQGIPTPRLMHDHPAIKLTALLGPEHGYAGTAIAGEKINSNYNHPWNIPVYSLYGETRKPTPDMLKNIDTIVFDLQDLPVRCYTYSSTLRYVMQAAAENHCRLIVTDRPCPLYRIFDGPILNPNFESFVGMINTPVCYGMTSGETARMIQTEELPDLDLQVIPFTHNESLTHPATSDLPWIPPSPALQEPMNAWVYPTTVFCEALPTLNYGKNTNLAFRILAAKWMDKEKTTKAINQDMELPGLSVEPISHVPTSKPNEKIPLDGILLTINNKKIIQPIYSMYAILSHLQEQYGPEKIWETEGTRPAFFDKLAGTNLVRENLQARTPPAHMQSLWQNDIRTFRQRIKPYLLYH